MAYRVQAQGTGAQRGAQLGEQFVDALPRAWERWVAHFERNNVDPLDLADRLTRVGAWDTARKHLPDLVDELEAMAHASGMPWHKVAALSMLDESWAMTGGMACTAIAITRDEVRVAGQTMDLPAWTDTMQTILNVKDADGLGVVAATYPGSLATCGANSNGVVVVVNALDLATDLTGMPVDFVTRGALHQPTAEQAIAFIRSIPHAVGQTYTVLDAHDLYMVEAAADGVIDVPLHELVSVHTNHAFTREGEISQSSATRLAAIEATRDSLTGIETLEQALTNKESGVCQVLGRFTADMYSFMGVMGDSVNRRVWVNVSPATGNPFEEVSFL